ncbi:MAG: hypothetical protein LC775_01820 [Acidobacteria bacterium]|nr:hypothetical protein [Acidobacteriota bacterium]
MPEPEAKRRMPLFWLSTLALSVAVIAIGAVWVLGWMILIRPAGPVTAAERLTAYFELFKVSLASVAAAGAAVGLVVAYRRQQSAEDSHTLAVRTEDRIATEWKEDSHRDRTRLLNERFTSASQQLGSDRPEIRLAGVYAMAGLADDWNDQRQTCVDVLCGYFRMASRADEPDEEVCKAVFQMIRDHLAGNAPARWSGVSFNFRGAQFVDQDLSDIVVDGETFDFRDVVVTGNGLSFVRSKFLSGDIDFERAIVEGSLNFAATALRQDFSINLEELKLDRGAHIHFNYVNIQDEAMINLGVHLNEESAVSFGMGNLHGGRLNFAGLHMDGGRLDLRIAILAQGVIKWPALLFGSGTIFVPEDEVADRLALPIGRTDSPNGIVIRTVTQGWRPPQE